MKPPILRAAILAVLTIASTTAAQEMGENSRDTGETKLRVGAWKLVRIETTATRFGGLPRESKGLPADTRERKGIYWGYGNRRITADLVFHDLKETVSQSNTYVTGASLRVFVKAAVTGQGINSETPQDDVTTMKCTFDFTSASGQAIKTFRDYSYRQYRIFAGSYYPAAADRFTFSKKGEFECGGDDMGPLLKVEEDFTLNYRLMVTERHFGSGADVDVTFHFFYKWAGWQYESPGTPTTESALISLVASRFNFLSGDSEKLSSAYADLSLIADNWASKASPASGQKMKVGSDWAAHKAWAAEQGPKAALAHLQQKLSNTFGLLNRSQQDSFSAEVSAALANVGNAQTAASAPVSEGGPGVTSVSAGATGGGPTIKTKKPVYAPNERIELEYANPAGHELDWIGFARPGEDARGPGLENKWSYIGKELNGTKSFDGFAEGQYEARYISWDGGNNRPTARVSFTVGNAPPPPPPRTDGPSPPTTDGPPPTTGASSDLSGFWLDDTGGGAVYRVRQVGNKVYWTVDGTSKGEYVNVFHGEISGNMIDGEWLDMPGSPLRPALVAATLGLRIESNDRLVKVRSGNFYPAQVWTRQGSPSGQQAGTGTTCAPGNPEKTVTIEVPANRAWTPTGVSLNSCIQVMVQASGTVQAAASGGPQGFYHAVPPGGRAQFHPEKPQPLLPALSMLGRIGNGPVVSVGPFARWYAGGPYTSGELFLGINDDGLDDNSGAWQVRITTFGAAVPPTTGGGPVGSNTVTGLVQKALPSGAQPTGNREVPKVEEIPETVIKPTSNTGPTNRTGNRGTVQPRVKEIPEVAVRNPANPGNVNRPGNTRPGMPQVEEIPDEIAKTSKPPTQRQPVEPTSGVIKKPDQLKVEEIPDDVVVTSQPPTRRTGSDRKPPVVEEIPEEVVVTEKPRVEEIPDTPASDGTSSNRGTNNSSSTNKSGENKLPPGLTRNKNGNLLPKDGYEWVNRNDPNDLRVKKKPRDPNKPDFWERLGTAAGQTIRDNTGGGAGNTGGTTGGSGTSGGTNTPPGVQPCDANEQAVFAKITGTWEASYGQVTFSGSCENVTGFWLQGAYGAKGTSQRADIKGGRVSGGRVTFNYYQNWKSQEAGGSVNREGSDSCRLSDDGKALECGWLQTLRR